MPTNATPGEITARAIVDSNHRLIGIAIALRTCGQDVLAALTRRKQPGYKHPFDNHTGVIFNAVSGTA